MHDQHTSLRIDVRRADRDFRAALIVCLFLALTLHWSDADCEAGFLAEFVGNTKGDTDPGNHRLTVHFAVLDRLTGPSSAGDVFGTGLDGFDGLWVVGGGSLTFDTTARYLYLYQFVESPTTASNWSLPGSGITTNPFPILTSYQQWSLFLADDSGNVSTTNDFVRDGIAFSPTAPANIGVTGPHVSASGDTGSLIGATFTSTPNSFGGLFHSYLQPGDMSGLWGVTSEAPPRFFSVSATSNVAAATVPIPIPEPASLVLLVVGSLGLIGGIPRMRRQSTKLCRAVLRGSLLGGGLVGVLLVGRSAGVARADFVYTHSGDADPATEGFTGVQGFGAASTFGPIANDLGNPAWSITGTAQNSQYAYASGPLSSSELTDIASHGFTLTIVARALLGIAPTYDTSQPVAIAGGGVNTGAQRFDIALGIDANGDTVVFLFTADAAIGPGSSLVGAGPSYTLTGAGNGYHTYVLVYDPLSELADLSVDGIDRIQDYAGNTTFLANDGLYFGAASGGQGNFNFVQVVSVPEPSSLLLLGMGVSTCIVLMLSSRRVLGDGWRSPSHIRALARRNAKPTR